MFIEKIREKKYLESDEQGPEIPKQPGLPQLVPQEGLSHQPTIQQNNEIFYWELQSLWTRKCKHEQKVHIYTV